MRTTSSLPPSLRHGLSVLLRPGAALVATLVLTGCAGEAPAQTLNGFDLSRSSIPVRAIQRGGPPRDGIPSIDDPKFIPPVRANFMREDDIVLSVTRNGVTRAYPFRILVWHEIVNDIIGDHHLAVTYCPLCGTGMVFNRKVGDQVLTFGVSGLLYHSDVMMYDRESESLWSQIKKEAVTGPRKGQRLEWVASDQMTWGAWRRRFSNGQVLSTDTGHDRNYGGQPYAGYFASDQVMFPVPRNRRELPQKAWVVGLTRNGQAAAYPLERLAAQPNVRDEVGGERITLRYDPHAQHVDARDAQGRPIPVIHVYWFAWQAFHPETKLWAP